MRCERENQSSFGRHGARAELLEKSELSVGAGKVERVCNNNIEEVGYFANNIL